MPGTVRVTPLLVQLALVMLGSLAGVAQTPAAPAYKFNVSSVYDGDQDQPHHENDKKLVMAKGHSFDYSFHTTANEHPWWMVDLGKDYTVTELIIYNRRRSYQERANGLTVYYQSDKDYSGTTNPVPDPSDLATWKVGPSYQGSTPFGGVDANGAEVSGPGGPWHARLTTIDPVRYIMLKIPRDEFLHLDRIRLK
jgi:hypothetical protein